MFRNCSSVYSEAMVRLVSETERAEGDAVDRVQGVDRGGGLFAVTRVVGSLGVVGGPPSVEAEPGHGEHDDRGDGEAGRVARMSR